MSSSITGFFFRGGSRTAPTSKMELFLIINSGSVLVDNSCIIVGTSKTSIALIPMKLLTVFRFR